MKNILSILLILISLNVSCQSARDEKINLVGVWILTDYNNPDRFKDTWEFTTDNIFNELKFKADGDTPLVPDENGTWLLKGEKLTITVTGEDTRGEQKLYKKPQILEFEITKRGEDYVLSVPVDGGASDGKTTKLRLTKK